VQSCGLSDDCDQRLPVRLELLFEHVRRIDETVPRHVIVDIHGLCTLDHRDPFRRERRAHRREDSVQIRLAHEEDLLGGQIDGEVASGVGPAEEEDFDLLVTERDGRRLIVHDFRGQHDGRGVLATVRVVRARSECGGGRRMGKEDRVTGERRVSIGVIAVVRADHDMRDRLVGDFGDVVDQALRLFDTPLTVRHQNTFAGDHEHAHGGEALVPSRPELLVGVDVGSELSDPREVLVRIASSIRVGGADERGWLRAASHDEHQRECRRPTVVRHG